MTNVALVALSLVGSVAECPAEAQPGWSAADARTKREKVRACLALRPAATPVAAPPVAAPVEPIAPRPPPTPVVPSPVMWGLQAGAGAALTPSLLTGGGCIGCEAWPTSFATAALGLEGRVAFALHPAVQLGPVLHVEAAFGPGYRGAPGSAGGSELPALRFAAGLGGRLSWWLTRTWGVSLQVELGATTLQVVFIKRFSWRALVMPHVGAGLASTWRFGARGEHQLSLEPRFSVMFPAALAPGQYLPPLAVAGSLTLSWTGLR